MFSDLDGSLLDHYTYSFEQAEPALKLLESFAIPLILCSSKTRAEIESIREALGNAHPFIVENGAAVVIPKAIAHKQPPATREDGEFWIYETVEPRRHWLDLLARLEPEYSGQFQSFYGAGIQGIQDMTGLEEAHAAAANDRQYSEPVEWLGTDENKQGFIARLEDAGATVQQGGRFLSTSGDCDKGRALAWLRNCYHGLWQTAEIKDLAAGDSANDRAMLEAAQTALLVKSPVHDFPLLQRKDGVLKTESVGPAGWNEGVTSWLHSQGLATQGH